MSECNHKAIKKEQQRKEEEKINFKEEKPEVPTDSFFYAGSMFGNLKQKVHAVANDMQLMAFAQN